MVSVAFFASAKLTWQDEYGADFSKSISPNSMTKPEAIAWRKALAQSQVAQSAVDKHETQKNRKSSCVRAQIDQALFLSCGSYLQCYASPLRVQL
jgi:hypothetical protein